MNKSKQLLQLTERDVEMLNPHALKGLTEADLGQLLNNIYIYMGDKAMDSAARKLVAQAANLLLGSKK